MDVRLNLYRMALIALLGAGLLGAVAQAGTGFYLHVPQNISIETNQYYTIFAQAGNNTRSDAAFPPIQIYTYQWYNTTGGHSRPMVGSDSRTILGITGDPGVYTYEVVATNQQGVSLVNYSTLRVTNIPSVELYSSKAVLDQGESYTLKSFYVPGAGNATYIWNISDLKVAAGCLYPANSTCTISTLNAVPGTYNISLMVKDGTTQGYVSLPVSARVVINGAPNLTATPTNSVASGGNVTYSVTVTNGIGPFNVYLYTTNGVLVDSRSIALPNSAGLLFFKAPNRTTSYYAVANDLGVAGAYSFRSAVTTVSVPTAAVAPPGSATNFFLIGIIVVLVIVIVIVYGYNNMGGSISDDGVDRMDSYDGPVEDEQEAAGVTENAHDAEVGAYETSTKLTPKTEEAFEIAEGQEGEADERDAKRAKKEEERSEIEEGQEGEAVERDAKRAKKGEETSEIAEGQGGEADERRAKKVEETSEIEEGQEGEAVERDAKLASAKNASKAAKRMRKKKAKVVGVGENTVKLMDSETSQVYEITTESFTRKLYTGAEVEIMEEVGREDEEPGSTKKASKPARKK